MLLRLNKHRYKKVRLKKLKILVINLVILMTKIHYL
nr:MAG TPA: hypothetical protein [Caudoviricetes sp.]